jgi:prolyl-tRNA synthetase
MRPRLFLRTSEFLWQEGHTAHATEAEARAFALQILRDVYEATMVEELAVPVLTGHKTARERFAGAIHTWTCEGMMGDGKALQMGTSHELGQNFSRVFGTQFSSEAGTLEYVWQTSWGVSTRLVGALIMAHGDDSGLRLPPSLAPVQVVVLLVRAEDGAGEAAATLADELRALGHRVRLDDRVETSFGRRSVEWELKGVPVRVEVGPRDLAQGQVTVVRRQTLEKRSVPLAAVVGEVSDALGATQSGLLDEARTRQAERTQIVSSMDEAASAAADGFAVVPWEVVGDEGEDQLATAGVSVRCLQRPDGSLAESEDEPDLVAVVARAY